MIDTDKYEGHTEGPWTLEEREDDEGHQWFEVPAVSYTTKMSGDGSQQEFADARLIADAPLLLEEVKRLREALAYTASLLTCRMEGDDIPIADIREHALDVVGMSADEAMATTHLMGDEEE